MSEIFHWEGTSNMRLILSPTGVASRSPSNPQYSPKAAVHHEIPFVVIGLWLNKPVRFSDAHHLGRWLYYFVFGLKRRWSWTWMSLMLGLSVVKRGAGIGSLDCGAFTLTSHHIRTLPLLITALHIDCVNCVHCLISYWGSTVSIHPDECDSLAHLPWHYYSAAALPSLSVALCFFSLRWYKQKCRRVMEQITQRLWGAEEEDDLLLTPVLTIKQPSEKPKSKCQQKIIPTEARLTISPLKPIDAARDTGTDRNVTVKHGLHVCLVVFGWSCSVILDICCTTGSFV